MENKKGETPPQIKEIVSSLLSENEIQPDELAEIIYLGFCENAGRHRIFSNKGLYHAVMREIFLRCKNVESSFSEWITSNKWELTK
jgi:hypothetical protein